MIHNYISKILFVALIISQATVLSQQNNIKSESYFYPIKLDNWKFKSAITLSFSQLPEEIIEEVNSLIYSPLINFDATFGIPYNFNLHTGITSNIITNHF